ncbi:MAG: MinD/ParA family protein, partial [Bradymonadaceae bacterium]
MNRIGPKLDANRPHVVGRSTLCAEVARSVGRRNERVLCVDAAWGCPTLHTLMSVDEPGFDLDDGQVPLGEQGSHIADFIQNTANDNIWLASIAAGRQFPYLRPDLSAYGLIDQLHSLDFDWVFLDLAPGLDPFDVGLFTLSDLPIVVGTPEPGAVRARSLSHSPDDAGLDEMDADPVPVARDVDDRFFQAVRYHPDAGGRRKAIHEILFRQRLDLSVDRIVEAAGDEETAEIVRESADRFEPYLVVNLVREGAEQDLGFVLCHAWYRALGLFPRMLATIDYENRRWFYHRRTTGTNAVRSDEALSRDIETLAQSVLDVSVVDARFPRPIPRDEELHPALRLGISPDSSRNEVRQHCRRLWEGYKREGAVDVIFDDEDTRTEIAETLETLYRKVLTLPSDTFDTVDIDEPSGASIGLSSSTSSSSSDARSTSSTRRARTAPSSSGEQRAIGSGESTTPVDADGDESDADSSDESDAKSSEEADADPNDASDPDDTVNQWDGETSEESAPEPLPDVGSGRGDKPGELVEALRRR